MERTNLTAMARLLRQTPSLCLSARETVDDVNEAYLVVHQVMSHAIGCGSDHDSDLGSALAQALRDRTKRLTCFEGAL